MDWPADQCLIQNYVQFKDKLMQHVKSQLKSNSATHVEANFKESMAINIERVVLLAGTDKIPVFNEPQQSYLSQLDFSHRVKCRILTMLLLAFLETLRLQEVSSVKPQLQYRRRYSQQLQKFIATCRMQMAMQETCFQTFLKGVINEIRDIGVNIEFGVFIRQMMRECELLEDIWDGGQIKQEKKAHRQRDEEEKKVNMEQMRRVASRKTDRFFVLIHR